MQTETPHVLTRRLTDLVDEIGRWPSEIAARRLIATAAVGAEHGGHTGQLFAEIGALGCQLVAIGSTVELGDVQEAVDRLDSRLKLETAVARAS